MSSFSAAADATFSQGESQFQEKIRDYRFSASGSTNVYFDPDRDKLFYFGSGGFDEQRSASAASYSVSAGIGYGRVWNATPLARALRIQAALMESGLLSKDLTDSDLIKLADVISLKDEYRVKHGKRDFKSVWYTAMDNVLANSGLLTEGRLSTFGTVKLDEVLEDERISQRRHGWVASLGAGVQFSDYGGLADNDPSLIFHAEYAKPVGLSGQWINDFAYTPFFGDVTTHSIYNRLSYTHEISKNIDWVNTWGLYVYKAEDSNIDRRVSNSFRSIFIFEVANQLDLYLGLDAVDESGLPDVSTTLKSSLVYRLK